MSRIAGIALLLFAGITLAGCSLPGQAFPGGPSPWLPGGAPGAVYGAPAATAPVPAATSTIPATATGAGPAAKRSSDSGSVSCGERTCVRSALSERGVGKLPVFRYNACPVSEPHDTHPR